MKKIIKYRIVNIAELTYVRDLPDQINALITQGWQPFGSPYLDRNTYICQAMVQYHPTETV